MAVIRKTSIQAYHAVMASGLVPALQKSVYEFVYVNQDVQGYEDMVSQGDVSRAKRDTTRSYAPRFVSLVRRGLFYPAGEKSDPVTKRNVYGYRTTDSFPVRDAEAIAIHNEFVQFITVYPDVPSLFLSHARDARNVVDACKPQTILTRVRWDLLLMFGNTVPGVDHVFAKWFAKMVEHNYPTENWEKFFRG